MRSRNLTLCGAALSLLMLLTSYGRTSENSPSDPYVRRTLQSVIDAHRESARKLQLLVVGYDYLSCTTVTYTGKQRALPPRRVDFLDKYFSAMKKPEVRALFESEILITEGEDEHWLPIEKPLLPVLAEEVKAGTQMAIHTSFLGAYREGTAVEWLFVVKGFAALDASAP